MPSVIEHLPYALYPGRYPSAISASSPHYDVARQNSEGIDSHEFRHSSTVAHQSQFSPLMQNFDPFTGDHKAMRVKQVDFTSQDNHAVNNEGSQHPVPHTKDAPNSCAQLLSPQSTFWPQDYGSLSSSANADPALYDGVLGSNYIQMGENTNLATSIEATVPFYTVGSSGKSGRYQCECGHVTRRKGDMRRHHEMRKHAHKNYTCSCGSSFTRSDSLRRHKKKTCKKGRIDP